MYLDSRDLTGFIDGTENPPVDEAARRGPRRRRLPARAGAMSIASAGSTTSPRSTRLAVAEQEADDRAHASRTASSSTTTPSRPRAHISRVVIEEDGEELEIYRRSVPVRPASRTSGSYFVAFSADRTRFDEMLARMFGTAGDGVHDHLTDFTKPVSGSYYFAPSLEAIAVLG